VLARYVGRYELAPGQVFELTLVEGQLQLRLGDQPRFPLFAESSTKFFLEAVDAQVSFVLDADGRPTSLVLHQGGRDLPAPRVE
jgi:D-alanyl-D-alanine-carboxypeptidase/D-alanyl-D-alanine-endopeptidase